jgi:hypothetical protein
MRGSGPGFIHMILKPLSFLSSSATDVPVEYISAAIQARSGTEYTVSLTTMPSHQAGDLLFAIGMRNSGTAVHPIPPEGWTSAELWDFSAVPAQAAYIIADSDSEVSGTWTETEILGMIVIRGGTGIGTIEHAYQSNTSLVIPYPAWTASESGSLLIAVGLHRGANASTWRNAPNSDVTNRVYHQIPTNLRAMTIHTSDAEIASSDGGNVVARVNTGITNDSTGYMIEILT